MTLGGIGRARSNGGSGGGAFAINLARLALYAALAVAMTGCASLRTLFDPPRSASKPGAAAGVDEWRDVHAPERLTDRPDLAAETSITESPRVPIDKHPSEDLWARVRAGLRIRERGNPRIQRELQWFAKHQAYLDRTVERAQRYLHHVVEETESRDLPSELALLPIIESAFQPFARSPSGASGIWQFISSTGRRYGLEQNWWYDGRRDIVASTGAAFDYLDELNHTFGGDWLLAIAAYNTGEGTILKAIRHNESLGKPTDFWSLGLPRETRDYVPRLLAIAEIVRRPDAYGLTLDPIPDRPYFEAVELDAQIDLALVAELAATSIDEIYRLNPGFSRWATAPAGPHRVLVPAGSTERFRNGLAELPPERLVAWKQHRIQPGETLSDIAERHHTSIAALQQINGLEGSALRAGKSLMVPAAARPLSEYTLSADLRQSKEGDRAERGRKTTYVVRRGDSLWSIARRHGASVQQLTAWNGIGRGAVLQPGQKLTLWSAAREQASRVVAGTNSAPAGALRHVRYIVQRGDSLWGISRRFKVSITALKKWNGMSRSTLLRPGQPLSLYLSAADIVEI